MGDCKYCGKPAGFFSNKHKECEEKHEKGLERIKAVFVTYCRGRVDANTLHLEVNTLKRDAFLQQSEIEEVARVVIKEYTDRVNRPFAADVIDPVVGLMRNANLSNFALNNDGTLDALAQKLIKGYMVEYFTEQVSLPKAQQNAQRVISALSISPSVAHEAYVYVLNKAADNFLKDGMLTPKEEAMVNDYRQAFGLSLTNLPSNSQNTNIEKLAQSVILRNFEKGILPTESPALPVILGKGEVLLWSYDGVTCYQEKIEKETVGRHGGFSFRIMKGVTYRTGQFKGKPVEHSYMNNIGTGNLFVTNKNLIFYSTLKSVKIPYNKLVGLAPYSDGVEVHQEGANAKRMALVGFDSWFLMNLMSMINN